MNLISLFGFPGKHQQTIVHTIVIEYQLLDQ